MEKESPWQELYRHYPHANAMRAVFINNRDLSLKVTIRVRAGSRMWKRMVAEDMKDALEDIQRAHRAGDEQQVVAASSTYTALKRVLAAFE